MFSELKGERFCFGHRAVNEVPRSGTPEDLYEMFGLSSGKLAEEIRQFVKLNTK